MGLDAQQRDLILYSEISALVFGRGEDFVLVRLDKTLPDDDINRQQIAERQLDLIGVLGWANGESTARLTPNPSATYTACYAGIAFAHIVADHLKQSQGDSVQWLERLHRMDS